MLTDNDLKSYIKSYLADRKISYTRLDKHDRAIEVLINENSRLNNIINELESYLKYNIETENPFYIKDTFEIVLNRLQELKGDSSNE